MTVCIAALCRSDGEEHAVVAADRMVTLAGFIEFEHAVPKMASTSTYAVTLVAGDTLVGTRLAQEVTESLAGMNPPIVEIAERLAGAYEATRTAKIEQQVLAPRGLDFQSFYAGHASFNGNITVMLDQQIAGYNLGVELLVAGVDQLGAHIFSIHNPGRPELQHDIIGYAAVGSGAIHAVQSMIGFGHSAAADYHETVFRVYASKRRSEVAPGVGRDTDMAVISSGGVHWLTPDELEQLSTIYDEFVASTTDALTTQLATFTLGSDSDGTRTAETNDG